MIRKIKREWARRLTALTAAAVLLGGGTALAGNENLPTGAEVQYGIADITTGGIAG